MGGCLNKEKGRTVETATGFINLEHPLNQDSEHEIQTAELIQEVQRLKLALDNRDQTVQQLQIQLARRSSGNTHDDIVASLEAEISQLTGEIQAKDDKIFLLGGEVQRVKAELATAVQREAHAKTTVDELMLRISAAHALDGRGIVSSSSAAGFPTPKGVENPAADGGDRDNFRWPSSPSDAGGAASSGAGNPPTSAVEDGNTTGIPQNDITGKPSPPRACVGSPTLEGKGDLFSRQPQKTLKPNDNPPHSVADLKSTIVALERQLDEKTHQVEQLRSLKDTWCQQLDDSRTKIEILERSLTDLGETCAGLSAERSRLETVVGAQKDKIQMLEDKNTDLEASCANHNSSTT